ncbi:MULTISPECIES: hypothetical protein [unclassified Methylophilus]|uniref:hypothetical protein n=1 Tax=unclassified Methylophilus TaxID=2630143 RepID=UPI00036990A3|nr:MULTISPECIES: hypothetical protein [unclassified Methylophilus]
MAQIPNTNQTEADPFLDVMKVLNDPPKLNEELDTVNPEITQTGEQTTFNQADTVQVAGLGNLVKGFAKGLTETISKARKPAKAASNALPPETPETQTLAPKKAKTTQEIKHGVIERSVPADSQESAIKTLKAMSDESTEIEAGRTALRNFRMDKLQTSDDVTRLIDDVANESKGFIESRRGVVSHEQTKTESEKYGVDELIGRKPSEAWNAAQLTAGRDILLELGSRISKSADNIKNGNPSVEDMLQFRQMLAQHSAVQNQLQGAVAEAGRALNIMKTVSAPTGRLRSQQMLESLDSLGGDDATRKLAEMVLDAGGDPLKLARVTRKGLFARTTDAVTEVWINGLLSNPKTHVVNVTSNALTSLMQVPERLTAGLIRSAVGGEGVELGEAGAQVYGMLAGMRDGLKAFAQTARTGEPTDMMTKLETGNRKAFTSSNFGIDESSPTGKALDLLGEHYVRLPGRMLLAEDELFKAIGYRQELQAQAYRQVKREGLTGEAADQRMADLVNEPTMEMHNAAETNARYVTFSDSLRGENWVQSVGQAGQKLSNIPLGKFVLPFIRTPSKIAEYTLERTPLALTMKNVRDDIAVGGAKRDLAIAKMGLGGTVSALVAAESSSGRITGGGPSDPKSREVLKATGWQPYSILLDGKYYAYNRLDPVGSMIGSAADAVDILKYSDGDSETEHVAAAVALGFANNMLSKTYMQSLASLLDVLGDTDNEKKATAWLSGQAASFEPGWLNFLRQAQDETIRQPNKSTDPLAMTIDLMKNRTPGLSMEIPPKTDIWGEPVIAEAGAFSPVSISSQKEDKEAEEVFNNQVNVNKPSAIVSVPLNKRTAQSVDLNLLDPTGWLYHDYKVRSGRLAKRYVSNLMNSRDYSSLSDGADGEKSLYIRRAFSDARHDALLELMSDQKDAFSNGEQVISIEDAALNAYKEKIGF